MSEVAEQEAVKGTSSITEVLTHIDSQPAKAPATTEQSPADTPHRTAAPLDADAEDRAEAREETEERLQTLYGEDDPAGDTKQPKQPTPQPAAATRETKAAQPAAAPAEAGPVWSNEDVELFGQMQNESRTFQADLQAFAQVSAQFKQLAKTNPEQAKQLAPKVQAAEKELRYRYATLQKGAKYVMGRLEQQQQAQLKARLLAENQKLESSLPDLDRTALVGYLSKLGFSEKEIGTTDDHRIIAMAEKARRYDDQQRTRRLKIPMRKGAGKRATSKPRLVTKTGDLLSDIQREHYDPRRDGPPSVAPNANGFQTRAALDNMYPKRAPTLLMPEKPPLERLRILYSRR